MKIKNNLLDEPNRFILEILSKNNKKVTYAESCTGGLCVSNMTKLSGVSAILNGSIISYSDEIKRDILKVKKSILQQYGAVSKEVVKEMLLGVLELFNSDYGVAISGIAGPTGGSKEKPVGLVYIAIGSKKAQKIYKNIFNGNREDIQKQSERFASKHLALFIKEEFNL